MDNYGNNATDASHMAARHTQPQAPHPPEMTHNPQGQVPHMFGNFNTQPSNGYPQMHMPVPMHQQIAQQANTNMPQMHTQYPPAQYPNPPAPGAAPVSAPAASFPPGRPREWETPDQRAAIERETKRARPYPTGPTDPSYTGHQAAPYNRNPPIGIPPQQHHAQPHVGVPHGGQQIPRMPPTTAPAIHPPSHPFVARPPFTAPMNMPARGPPPQQRDDFQFPRKPASQYSTHPPTGQQPSYDSLPAPPRKEIQSVPDRNKPPSSEISSSADKQESQEREETPISFKDFLLKQPDSISPQDAKEKYDLYVRDFTRKKPNKFFNLHKDEEWFKERYDPDYVLARAERIKEEVRARAGDYKQLWDKGGSAVCAPEISSACLDKKQVKRPPQVHPGDQPDKETSKTEDHAVKDAEGTQENDSGDAKQEPTVKGEDETGQAETADEVKDQETSPKVENAQALELKAEEKPDEVDADKPEDGRDEMKADEEKDAESQKQEDVVPSAETKRESSEKTEEPVKTAIPTDEVTEQVEESKTSPETPSLKDQKIPSGLVLPLRREHQKHTIFMRGIPVNLKRKDLTRALQHGADGKIDLQLRRLKIGDINPMRGLERFAWAVYASEEAAAIAIEKVRGVVVRSEPNKRSGDQQSHAKDRSGGQEDDACVYEIDCMINLQRKKRYTQGRILPPALGAPDRMEHDVAQSIKMMRYLDKLRGLADGVNPLTDEFLRELPFDDRRLDHIVTYLREVHYFCYYSGNEFLEDSTSMPPQELRPHGERLNRTMSENDWRVVKRVDERAKWVLERDYDRPRSNSDSAEMAKKTAIQRWLDSNTKNEGQGRYRCGLPPHKLFKGPEFVHKHLRTKHGDKMETVMARAYLDTYRANFENDPSKDEVISIYNDGLASAQQKASGGRPVVNQPGRPAQQFGFAQGRQNAPMGVYNPASGFMGMGMQPFPMMMMPSAPGYPASYTAAGGYPNTMALAGPGMGGMGAQGMNPSMMQMGMQGVDNSSMQGRPSQRSRDSSRDFRDGGYRGGGYRDGGHRGGRRGGYVRRGGDQFRRGHGDGRPLDPRASGPRRTYNDLDAPANGPSFDLVRYDEA